ncbi:hypothetical protein M408DRAFT_146471 [Serendipita vermifera MAFF 305830]|uniref:Uncharacterized protein n=1 Tax=Serendipita vermifera MAFF 305830 TaxID=933852 RepID=A0A0C3B924_SERVB|nr:hypothetical protein M408DRAFT_146471 [Serendipita vermifera MAFF 305830]
MCRQVWKKSADTVYNQASERGNQHEQLVVDMWLVLLRWVCLMFIKDTVHEPKWFAVGAVSRLAGAQPPIRTLFPGVIWVPLNSGLDISSKRGARNLGGMRQSDIEGTKTKWERRVRRIRSVQRSNSFCTCPLSNCVIQSSFDWPAGQPGILRWRGRRTKACHCSLSSLSLDFAQSFFGIELLYFLPRRSLNLRYHQLEALVTREVAKLWGLACHIITFVRSLDPINL